MRLRHIALFVITATLGAALGHSAGPVVPYGYNDKKHLVPADATPASTLPAPLNTTYSFLDPTSPVQAQINGKQASDPDLSSIASLTGPGFLSHPAADTYVLRSFQNGTGTTCSNCDGSMGNPSFNTVYGNSANQSIEGTNPRVCPATAAGKLYYDTGTGCGESVAGSANQVWTSTGTSAPSPVSTLNGISHIGIWTIGGTVSLAASISGAGLFKLTNLAAPTIGSTDSATAVYAEAQKTGSIVTIGILGAGVTWSANNFIGNIAGTNASASNLGVWHTPVAGVLKNFEHNSATTGVSSPTNITIYKASTPGPTFGCGSFSSTAAVIAVVTGGARGITATSITLIAGDCIALRTDQIINSGNPGGITETAQFIPN